MNAFPPPSTRVRGPVCGMDIDPEATAANREHGGTVGITATKRNIELE